VCPDAERFDGAAKRRPRSESGRNTNRFKIFEARVPARSGRLAGLPSRPAVEPQASVAL